MRIEIGQRWIISPQVRPTVVEIMDSVGNKNVAIKILQSSEFEVGFIRSDNWCFDCCQGNKKYLRNQDKPE